MDGKREYRPASDVTEKDKPDHEYAEAHTYDDEKKKRAYERVLSDRALIAKITRGDAELIDDTLGNLGLRITRGSLRLDDILDDGTYRSMIYRNAVRDVLRERTRRAKIPANSFVDAGSYEIVDSQTPNAEQRLMARTALRERLEQLDHAIDEWVENNPRRKPETGYKAKQIIRGFLAGKNIAEIAEELDTHESRVSQIVTALAKGVPEHKEIWDTLRPPKKEPTPDKRTEEYKSALSVLPAVRDQILRTDSEEKKYRDAAIAYIDWLLDENKNDEELVAAIADAGVNRHRYTMPALESMIEKYAGRSINFILLKRRRKTVRSRI